MASLTLAEKAPAGKPGKLGSPHDSAEREADRVTDLFTAPEEQAMPECAACATGGAPCAVCSGARHLYGHIPARGGMHHQRFKPLQAKLSIGQPNDVFEQEADRVAEHVMRMAPTSSSDIQLQQEDEESEEIQRKSLAERITPIVQRQKEATDNNGLQTKCDTYGKEKQVQRFANGIDRAQLDFERRLNASSGGGSPLPDEVRLFMEPRFGTNFSQVHVHTDSNSVQMNRDLSAQAFTHRNHIYYGAGKAPAKDWLTGHELAHVVQQRQQNQDGSLPQNILVAEKSISQRQAGYAQMKRKECGHRSSSCFLAHNRYVQPRLALSQVDSSRVQADRSGERRYGPQGWYLQVEPPSPIIWLGTEVTVRVRHDQGGSSGYFSWRSPEFGVIDSDGRRYPWRMESTSDYPLEFVHTFNHTGRKRIYFRGQTYVEGVGGFPGQLGSMIEREYAIEVSPRAERIVLESSEDLEREDMDALQSLDTNRGQLISSFQRLAIRRALEVLSVNKEEAIRLRDIYDDPGSDALPRVVQARQFYPIYAQLRERRENFLAQAHRPRPTAATCSRTGDCEAEWLEARRVAEANLRQVDATINVIEQEYPELHASHDYRQQEATMTLNFSEITHVALRQVERDIDNTRYRLVTNDLNIFELHDFINDLLRSVGPGVRSAIHELQEEQASRDLGASILLCGLSLALLFVPGGAFISAVLGAGVGIGQAASSWDRSDDVSTCTHSGVRGGLCTREEADEARSTAIWDSIFAVVDVVDFVGEAADVIRAVRGSGAARAVDAAHEGTRFVDDATDTAPQLGSSPSDRTGLTVDEGSSPRGVFGADDAYEEARRVEMFGHEQTPDGLHDVEAYRHGVGRCSSTPGQFCPLIPAVYDPVLRRRPGANAVLISLQGRMRRFAQQGEEVPHDLLAEMARLEMRLRNLEVIDRLSAVPSTYRIEEVTHASHPDGVPQPGIVLEFPDGQRVWRDTPGGPIRHEDFFGVGVDRQHLEEQHYSHAEYGRPAEPEYERCHTLGAGTGFESPYAILDCPRFVNQYLQNHGIELYMRRLAEAAPDGISYRRLTTTAPIPGTRRLGEISYRVEIVNDGQVFPFFEYTIQISGSQEHPQIVAHPIIFAGSSIAQIHRQYVPIPQRLNQSVVRIY